MDGRGTTVGSGTPGKRRSLCQVTVSAAVSSPMGLRVSGGAVEWRGGMRSVPDWCRDVTGLPTLGLVQWDASGPPDGPAGGPVSVWPLGDELATALLGLLEVDLRRRGRRWRVVDRDRLEIARVGEPWPGRPADLTALLTLMAERPKADWPELVEQFAEKHCVERHCVEQLSADQISADDPRADSSRAVPPSAGSAQWSRIADSLRVRVLPTDPGSPAHPAQLSDEGDSPHAALQRPVADGLVEAVVAERPGGARSPNSALQPVELCTWAEVESWQVPTDTVFERARANTRADPAPQAEPFAVDGAPLTALFGPSHYTAAHALWLPEHVAGEQGWQEGNGALCVIPHRHLVVAHVIESAAVVTAVGALLRFASRQYETSPGPISDQLYWWQGGGLTRLPSDSVGQTLQLFPTERFATLLHRLRGD
jgi:hypothetical protein